MSCQGIIFDMDNTLLQSNIDFFQMKKGVFKLLESAGLLDEKFPWQDKTTSQLIELGKKQDRFQLVEQEVWKFVEQVEAIGMQGAVLEPYTVDILEKLRCKQVPIALLTNNASRATRKVLRDLSVYPFFDLIIGRDQVEELKPSPVGVKQILHHWPDVPAEQWILVGDSWIDGMAARQAGVRFLAYQSDLDQLAVKGVCSIGRINSLLELEHWI